MNQILATEGKEENNKISDKEEKIESLDYSEYNNYDEVEDFTPNNFNNYESNNNYEYNEIENNFSNEYSNQSKSTDMKKIIIIFAIGLIILALVIIGVIAISYSKKKEIENSKPEVSMTEIEDSTQLKLSASYKKGIGKIIYYWNDEKNEAKTIESSGETVSNLIDIPNGKNTLTVVVYDKDGNEETFTKECENNVDNEKPTIELSIVEEDASLKIVATDETGIGYIEYYWGEDDAKTIYPDETGALTIEKNIEIQRGKNKLTVKAVDMAGNESEETKQFNGVNKPEIDMYVKNEYLVITVSHDIGIKSITFNINENKYTFDETTEGYEDEKLMVIRKIKLQEGTNKIEVTATSLEDTSDSKKGEHVYNP